MPEFIPDELEEWSEGEWFHNPNGPILGICHDTRHLRPGELYVAIQGEHYDGHEFIEEAFQRGARAVMADKSGFEGAGKPILKVEDTLEGLQNLASGYRKTLKGEFVGITGSVGKTTVKEMLAKILAATAATSATRGNWNNLIGLPLSLLAMERRDRFGVFEVAMNRPGEIARLCRILQPHHAVMTPVGIAHSEHFATKKDIAREKSSLLRALPEGGIAILSKDLEWYSLFCKATKGRRCTVALGEDADYSGKLGAESKSLDITHKGERIEVELPLAGEHIARDALLAAAMAVELGVPAGDISRALADVGALPLRGESFSIERIEFANDAYNANPLSMEASIAAFCERCSDARKWLVLGGMHELGEKADSAHSELGEYAASRADFLILVGGYAQAIARGARSAKSGGTAIFECADQQEAARILHRLARSGDCVFIKASRAERLEKVIEIFETLAERRED